MSLRIGLEVGEHTLAACETCGIEGAVIDGGQLAREGMDKTLAPLRERGLDVCQIGAFMFNPISTDAAMQQGEADVLRQIIPLAKDTGCRYVTIGPGNYHPSGFGHYDPRNFSDAAIDEVAEGLKPFVEIAEKHDAILTVEAYLKGVIHSADTFKKMHAKIGSDHLKCNLDPTSQYDFGDIVNPSPKVEACCNDLAGHYGLVHLKEVGLDEGFHLHMGFKPMGDGVTDWDQVIRLAKPHVPDDSWIVIEHAFSVEEAQRSVQIVRDAIAKTE